MTGFDPATAFRLDGKVAAVTGGANGIGRAAAFALGRAGSLVHVLDRDPVSAGQTVESLRAEGVHAEQIQLDVTREAVDDVERGAQDSDWQPVKDAAKQIAFAEDRAIFHGYAATGVVGIAPGSSNPALSLPADVREVPDAVAQALSALRLAGVDGPYSLLLSAELYTAISETTDHGYPVRDHVARLLHDGEIVWAPALEGALLVSTRSGDYELHLGQDLSIGYLSHDAEHVELYLQESLTFLLLTAEAGVSLSRAGHVA